MVDARSGCPVRVTVTGGAEVLSFRYPNILQRGYQNPLLLHRLACRRRSRNRRIAGRGRPMRLTLLLSM